MVVAVGVKEGGTTVLVLVGRSVIDGTRVLVRVRVEVEVCVVVGVKVVVWVEVAVLVKVLIVKGVREGTAVFISRGIRVITVGWYSVGVQVWGRTMGFGVGVEYKITAGGVGGWNGFSGE
jgi:hypothetical protein